MSIPLSKFIAPEFIYGTGAAKIAGQYAQNIGVSRILVVTDKNISAYSWFKEILASIASHKIHYTCFEDVTENPKDYECVAGASLYTHSKSQLILAIGGGSVMDCAKAIGILVTNGGEISDYEGVDEIGFSIPPLVCIPTTAGSAADISQFAIITNSHKAYKMAIVSKTLVPDLALIDPALTLTVSREITIDTGLDVLAHAIESYVSNAASSFTRLHALEAVDKVLLSLLKLQDHLDDLHLRDQLMQASLQAGLSFSNASLGLIHAIAHALGGRYNLIHGALNGMLLPAVCAYNAPWAPESYQVICQRFEALLNYPRASIDLHLKRFIDQMRSDNLKPITAVNREGYQALIPYILKDPCIATNPRPVQEEDVRQIYDYLKP